MNELYHHGIKGQKWGVRRFQNKDGSLTPAGEKRHASRYDIPKGTTLYRADSDPTKKFMDRKYTYVNVTDNLEKHIANTGGDTDNYKLKTTRSLKIASTADYFNAVTKANCINPDKILSAIPNDIINKGKYAVENILSNDLLEGWGGKNKPFNNAVKYLEQQGYDGFIDPQDGAQQEKHGQAPIATVIFNPKKEHQNCKWFRHRRFSLQFLIICFIHTKTIVKDSPLMGKNSILTKLVLLQTLAVPCTKFRIKNLRWMISRQNI